MRRTTKPISATLDYAEFVINRELEGEVITLRAGEGFSIPIPNK